MMSLILKKEQESILVFCLDLLGYITEVLRDCIVSWFYSAIYLRNETTFELNRKALGQMD